MFYVRCFMQRIECKNKTRKPDKDIFCLCFCMLCMSSNGLFYRVAKSDDIENAQYVLKYFLIIPDRFFRVKKIFFSHNIVHLNNIPI